MDNKQINTVPIPTTFSQLPLSKGKLIMGLPTSGITEAEYYTNCYAILTDQDFEQLTIGEALIVKQQINDLLSSGEDSKINYEYDLAGHKYFLEYDLSRCSFGMYVDLERIMEQSQNNIWNNIEQLIACVIRPIQPSEKEKKRFNFLKRKPKVEISNYELEDYDFISRMQRQKIILENMNTQDAINILLFFCLIGNSFLQILFTSTQQVMESNQS